MKHDAGAPRSVDEALRRSAGHARNAVAEALLAAHALVDAVALGVTGEPASGARSDDAPKAGPLGTLSMRIASLAERVRSDESALPDSLARAILEALEAEIARWEVRARDDRDARAVLRAFLGLREILWELGMRDAPRRAADARSDGASSRAGAGHAESRAGDPTSDASGATAPPRSARPQRVQRIDVEG